MSGYGRCQERTQRCGRYAVRQVLGSMSDSPRSERANRYREMADDADRIAARTKDTISDGYRTIAKQWRKLADDVEETEAKSWTPPNEPVAH